MKDFVFMPISKIMSEPNGRDKDNENENDFKNFVIHPASLFSKR